MSMCCRSIARVRNILIELKEQVPTVQVYEDNQRSMKWAKNGNMRTKHIDVSHHYVGELLERGVIKITYYQTDRMHADTRTKPVSALILQNFITDLQMSS